jgi:hypothetical protein
MSTAPPRTAFSPIGVVKVSVSLAVVTAAITITFLSMRAVMAIGGFCAEGGPFVIETHCPDGVPVLLIGSIWIGLGAAFYYFFAAGRHGAVGLGGLFWPALFLSLGWNFFEFGIDPPFEGGIAWGWILPGVLFVIMGAVPLFLVLPLMFRSDSRPRSVVGTALGGGMQVMRDVVAHRRSPDPSPHTDFVSELERLTRLNRSGALSDAEFDAAKRRLLGDS